MNLNFFIKQQRKRDPVRKTCDIAAFVINCDKNLNFSKKSKNRLTNFVQICYNITMNRQIYKCRTKGGTEHMKLNIMAKKIQIGPSFSEYAEKKLNQKLDKFFEDEAEAKITLNELRGQIVCELTVRAGSMIYRAEQSATDKNDALDSAIDKIIRKIRRNKTKLGKRIKASALSPEAFTDTIEEQTEYNLIRKKSFRVQPMSVEEAILQMEMLGHDFFVFLDMDTDAVSVVYKRKGGEYGLIETDRR